MAVPGGLTRGFAKSQKKVAVVQTSVTGTGAITSGLASVDTGGAQVTSQNSATTIPTNLATVTSISGGTVNAAVVAAAAGANTISAVACLVGLVAIGQ